MAISFQYNKTSMQDLQRLLKVRRTALPVLKSREAALRLSVLRQKEALRRVEEELAKRQRVLENFAKLWPELAEDFFSLGDIVCDTVFVAGVKVPQLRSFGTKIKAYSTFHEAAWIFSGLTLLEDFSRLLAEKTVARRRMDALEKARRTCTQRVNLFEKVQIPQLNDGIRSIKRYLEDVENLDKASQKMSKARSAASGEKEQAS